MKNRIRLLEDVIYQLCNQFEEKEGFSEYYIGGGGSNDYIDTFQAFYNARQREEYDKKLLLENKEKKQ